MDKEREEIPVPFQIRNERFKVGELNWDEGLAESPEIGLSGWLRIRAKWIGGSRIRHLETELVIVTNPSVGARSLNTGLKSPTAGHAD